MPPKVLPRSHCIDRMIAIDIVMVKFIDHKRFDLPLINNNNVLVILDWITMPITGCYAIKS